MVFKISLLRIRSPTLTRGNLTNEVVGLSGVRAAFPRLLTSSWLGKADSAKTAVNVWVLADFEPL